MVGGGDVEAANGGGEGARERERRRKGRGGGRKRFSDVSHRWLTVGRKRGERGVWGAEGKQMEGIWSGEDGDGTGEDGKEKRWENVLITRIVDSLFWQDFEGSFFRFHVGET